MFDLLLIMLGVQVSHAASCKILLTRHKDSTRGQLNDIIVHATENDCNVIIHEMGGTCLLNSSETQCFSIPNYGREIGSFLYFVLHNYNNLTDVIITSPSNSKHNRVERRKCLIENKGLLTFDCGRNLRPGKSSTVRSCFGFSKRNCKTYFHWWESNICWPLKDCPACYNGIFRTTRQLIQRRPLSFYSNLYAMIGNQDTPTIIYALERAAEFVFGGKFGDCPS